MEEKVNIVKMAYLYSSNGEWEKAIGEYRKLLALDPLDPHVLSMLGDAYVKKGDSASALEVYRRARKLYEKIGNYSKIQGLDRKIGKLDVQGLSIPDRHFVQGVQKILEADRLAQEGQVDEAIARYQEWIAAEPLNYTYREKLAALLIDHARVSEAAVQLQAVAMAYVNQDRLEEAAEAVKKLEELEPNAFSTLQVQWVLAEKTGDKAVQEKLRVPLAKAALEEQDSAKALELLSGFSADASPEVQRLFVRAALMQKNFGEARDRLKNLLQAFPDDSELLEKALEIEESQKNWPTALDFANRLAKLNPENLSWKVRCAKILIQMREVEEATRIYGELYATALQKKQPDAAWSYLEAVLAFRPTHLETWKKRAELALRLNRRKEAVESYEKLLQLFREGKKREEAQKVERILAKLKALS